jgi:hypothetical protein
MTVHSYPAQRPARDRSDTLATTSPECEQIVVPPIRVMIRRGWVRAVDGRGATDCDASVTAIVRRGSGATSRRAA